MMHILNPISRAIIDVQNKTKNSNNWDLSQRSDNFSIGGEEIYSSV